MSSCTGILVFILKMGLFKLQSIKNKFKMESFIYSLGSNIEVSKKESYKGEIRISFSVSV